MNMTGNSFSQRAENQKGLYVPDAALKRAQDTAEHSERSDY